MTQTFKNKVTGTMVEAFQLKSEIRQQFGPFPEWALPKLTGGRTEKINNSEWIEVATPIGIQPFYDGDYITRSENGDVIHWKKEDFENAHQSGQDE